MIEPEYTTPTDDLGDFTLAAYICEVCEREWYDDASTDGPEHCPYCGFTGPTADSDTGTGEGE